MNTLTHYPYDCNEENMVHVVDPHGEYHHGKERFIGRVQCTLEPRHYVYHHDGDQLQYKK